MPSFSSIESIMNKTPRKSRSVLEARARARANAGGAVLVEATIVISLLIIGFMSLVFFKDFYIRQLTTLRLARASIIAHGMGGCEANYPVDWISPGDLGLQSTTDPEVDSESAESGVTGTSTEPSDSGSDSRAGELMTSVGQTSSSGTAFLNEIAGNQLSGMVRVGRTGPEATATPIQSEVGARSYVSCGDQVVYETGFDDAFAHVGKVMGEFMSFDPW